MQEQRKRQSECVLRRLLHGATQFCQDLLICVQMLVIVLYIKDMNWKYFITPTPWVYNSFPNFAGFPHGMKSSCFWAASRCSLTNSEGEIHRQKVPRGQSKNNWSDILPIQTQSNFMWNDPPWSQLKSEVRSKGWMGAMDMSDSSKKWRNSKHVNTVQPKKGVGWKVGIWTKNIMSNLTSQNL